MVFPLSHLRETQFGFPLEARRVVVFSDFDGTISHQDSLKLLLNQYAQSHWPTIEAAMATQEMPESLGLQASFDQLNLSFEEALRFVLREVKLDPEFTAFASWIEREGHELSILSGGFENFIRPLLRREGLQGLKLLANRVSVRSNAWTVSSCPTQRLCSLCNHCKSASLLNEIKKDPRVFLVYIGDGHTDTCAIQLADLIFAKSYLADYCLKNEIQFQAFEDFSDVRAKLDARLKNFARVLAA